MKNISYLKFFLTSVVTCLLVTGAAAQNHKVALWNSMSFHGSLNLLGQYRSQQSILKNNFIERPVTSLFTGQILLLSKSYVLHPNFLLLDLDVDYQPANQREKFLVIPDRTETRTFERGRLRTTFFNQRPLSFGFVFGRNFSYINREFVSNVENRRSESGGFLSFRNKIIPIRINFDTNNDQKKEIQSGRSFKTRRKSFQVNSQKSFTRNDDHQFSYSHNDYARTYFDNLEIQNKISTINLKNRFTFGSKKQSSYNSFLWKDHQTGNNTFDRFNLSESLNLMLQKNLKFSSNYQLLKLDQPAHFSKMQQTSNRIVHQLYLSLQSQIYHQYSQQDQSTFNESINTVGFTLNYQKKLPGGFLKLNFSSERDNLNKKSLLPILNIVNEEHLLKDDHTVLLKNPYINRHSIRLTDRTENIIYQENLDYILIQRDIFFEVQRLLGGQITNGETVFIDYNAQQQPSYNFDSYNNNFGARISLFDRIVEIYFRSFKHDFGNISASNIPVLKHVDQHIIGFRSSFKNIMFGVEQDDFNSNIVPYRSERYFFNVSGSLNKQINMIINGTHKRYLLTQENEKQIFSDISAKILYSSGRNIKSSVDYSYRFQEGRNLDLSLMTFRGEISTRFHDLFFTLGFETFRRDFLGEKVNFNGSYIRVERKF